MPAPCQWLPGLASALDTRPAPSLALRLPGAVLAPGRRTVTTWIRAAKLGDRFRPCDTAGKRADRIARRLRTVVVGLPVADAAGSDPGARPTPARVTA